MTTFSELHHHDLPLLMPDAWDVPSALALFDAGFSAIGTTSLGVASGLGRPDGSRSTAAANVALAAALTRLPCHVSVDIEDGYADEPDAVADYVADLHVAGINIEDSTADFLIPARTQAAKIAAIKATSPDLFVNARVDTYWLHQDETIEATLDRARAYVDAGADGIFVPGASDSTALRLLTATIPVPVNVLPIPGMTLREVAELGIRRVSTGSLPYRAAIQAAVDTAEAVRDNRELPPSTPYRELQTRLVAYASTPA